MPLTKRFDILVMQKFGYSRDYAQDVIAAGFCNANGKVITKPGAKVNINCYITSLAPTPYVSRGGFKLAFASKAFGINFHNKDCLDIGASTGGFTHFMLLNQAQRIIALDNGIGQLADILKNEPRVISLENTDIRNITAQSLPFLPNFICCDVSFISLTKIIPVISKLLKYYDTAILLLKPQFECGSSAINKQGIVKQPQKHILAIDNIANVLADNSLNIKNLHFSPIKGKKGNIEYLIYVEKNQNITNIHTNDISKYVKNAFDFFIYNEQPSKT